MIFVCAGVVLRSGMILLARRAPGREHAGLWEFPGGRIEEGETPEAALIRELSEELGIKAEVGAEVARVQHLDPSGHIELIALLVPTFSGELTLKDHDKIAWVEARRLLDYDLTPADIEVAKIIASHRRRGRYQGTHPRRFEEKYKELSSQPEALMKAKARGSTPAGAHWPVMLAETIEALEPLENATILDCTLGWGGHAEELLRRAGPKGRLIGLDRDADELARAKDRIHQAGLRVTAVHSDYARALDALRELKVPGVDALLVDCGVSSMQLDDPSRGMSFKRNGPLDMRMDRSSGKTAAAWLAASSEQEIAEALRRYGDEPDAGKIAKTLSALKSEGRLPNTTAQLAAAVSKAKGLGLQKIVKKTAFAAHPATRTFQALRIAVNAERDSLRRLLSDLPAIMSPGGRAVFLTFHSGEEALVQDALGRQAAAGLWRAPLDAPRKPLAQEVRENPRARSARLWRAVRTQG